MDEDDLEVVRRAFQAFDRRDLESMLELADPSLEFWAVTGEEAGHRGPYRGHEGMRDYFADVAAVWDEVRPMPGDFERRGDLIVVTGRIYARGGGRIVDNSAGWHWRVRDGRLVYGRVFRSSREALSAAPDGADLG